MEQLRLGKPLSFKELILAFEPLLGSSNSFQDTVTQDPKNQSKTATKATDNKSGLKNFIMGG